MEQIEGFIQLPIKMITSKAAEKLEEEYNKLEKEYERLESLGIDPDKVMGDKEIDTDKYTEVVNINVRPESISAFKPAEDGNVDVAIASVLDYSRIYMKYEEFVELLKSTK